MQFVSRCLNSCVAAVLSRPCACAKLAFPRVTHTSFFGMAWDSRCLYHTRSVIPWRPAMVSRLSWPSSTPGAFDMPIILNSKLKTQNSKLKTQNSNPHPAGASNSASPSSSSASEFLPRSRMNAVPSSRRTRPDFKPSSAATRRAGVPRTGAHTYASLQRAGWCRPSAYIAVPWPLCMHKPSASAPCVAAATVRDCLRAALSLLLLQPM